MNARQRRKGVALGAPCARRTWCEPATAWRVAGSIAVALGVLTVGTTGAGFVRLEDFESLATGPIQGQNGWVNSGGDGRVVSDPADPGNKVLAVANTYANVYRALGNLTISNSYTGTVFFRLRWPGTGFSIYAGLTDVAAPAASAVNDFEPHLRCEPSAPAVLKARDAGVYDALATLQSNAWYDVWLVVNNALDLFAVYLQGGLFTNQVRLSGQTDGETWFTFRNTTGDGFNSNTAPVANPLLCFNLKTTSSHVGPLYVDDVYLDPQAVNLTSPRTPTVDTQPPVIVALDPPAGTAQAVLRSVSVTFSEAVMGVAAAHLRVNGAPATNVGGAGATWTWQFPQPPAGTVNLSWAASHTITDLASNRFDGVAASWSYQVLGLDVTPPALSSVNPPPGSAVGELTSVTVTFTEPVVVVEAGDLLVNGLPASRISGTGSQRTFVFSQPVPGAVEFTWDGSHAISDGAGNRFNELLPGATWNCTLLDKLPPRVATAFPVPGAAVGNLTDLQVMFNEPVTGVDPADLRVNGAPATAVSGSGAGPYLFAVAQPAQGSAAVTWAPAHGIQDTATPANAFAGGGWSYAVSAAASQPDVALNEILADNLTGRADEDGDTPDWIELQNRSAVSVNLAGWALTDDAAQPGKWVFPARTLGPGAFLVVFASGKDRAPASAAANLHTNFRLGLSGYLGLFNAEVPRRAVSEFAPAYPDQRGDVSWGRAAGNALNYFATPTPGASNSSPVTYSGVVALPAASAKSGFYDQPFSVALSCRTPDAEIRYTLDGSPPTMTSARYTAPLPVAGAPAKAVVLLRAAAFKTGLLSSPVLTRTFVFPDYVARQPALPAGFPTVWDSPCSTGSNCRDTAADYEMDPQVVNRGTNVALIRQALTALATVSVVTHVDLLFGPAQGVYVRREDFNQQPVSFELLLPDGGEGVQADAGLEIQGGTSPTDAGGDWKCKALSLRLIFRGDFGPVTKLHYALFPDSPVQEFNTLILDAGMNMTWHHLTDADQRNRASYVRDQYTSDLMNAVGTPAPHGRFVHLYLNGLYWGFYDLHERPDDSWFADYFGGDKTEYDVLRHTGNAAGLVSGNLTAWNQMLSAARTGLASRTNYERLANEHLDVPAFIDYMLVNLWVGNTDWAQHNWYAGRRRAPQALWRFVSWDAEHVCKSVTENRIGVNNANSPGELFQLLRANPEFCVAFGDHVHRHCFNGGVFDTDPANPIWTPEYPERNRPADLYLKRIHEIDPAIVAESARWGDTPPGRADQPYTRDLEFMRELNSMLGLTNSPGNTVNYFPLRNATVLDQFRAALLYPLVAAPAFRQHGGQVPPGYALVLTNRHGAGTVWFATNGADPRCYGSGAVSAQAVPWSGVPVVLDRTLTVKARCLAGTNWSALNEATFHVTTLGPQLTVTELNYNPPGGKAYEFLELRHLGTTEFDASGCSFEGISFAFPPGTRLAPGQLVVLANNANPAAFASRYPGVTVFGWFGGRLDNGGERITLRRPTGAILFSLDYAAAGWPAGADGNGYSLEIIDPAGDLDAPANWRATSYLGTPGALSPNPPLPSVRLSEFMARNVSAVAHTNTFPDWVELFNVSPQQVDLGGWSLTDDDNPRKFVFPAGTLIDEGGFLVVWCDSATNLPGLHASFALDQDGETLALFNAATSRVDAVTFGRQVPDLSLGRIGQDWTLTAPTPEAPNTATPIAPLTSVFINEWLANAPPGGADWFELFNAAPLPAPLCGATFACNGKVHQVRSLSFLGPGDHLQLFADEKPGPNHLDLTLPASGSTLVLYDAAAVECDRVTYGPQVESVSEGRLPDGSPTIARFALSPSPGASNYLADYSGPFLNEVMALNRSTLTNASGRTPDWLELRNASATPFDLTGYRLGTSAQDASAWPFPAGAVMPADSHWRVWCDDTQPASLKLDSDLNTGFALNAGGDTVCLLNPRGLVVDVVAFGPQAADLSLGRLGNEWRLLAAPTPASPNAGPASLGTPASLRLNEWLASPPDAEDDFFELYNSSPLPIELGGLFLTDDLSISGRTKFQIAPLSFIGPLGFTRFKADGRASAGRDHVNFQLNAEAGALRLSSAGLNNIDTILYGLQRSGVSEGRWPDGTAAITTFPCPTPGASNGSAELAIAAHPKSLLVSIGGAARFSVSVSGRPFVVQWFHDGAALTGASNLVLLLASVQAADAGAYYALATNACSSATSTVAQLTVEQPPRLSEPATLGNDGFAFRLHGQPGLTYAVEKTTNLTSWNTLGNVTLSDGYATVRDPSATNASPAFYRARYPTP